MIHTRIALSLLNAADIFEQEGIGVEDTSGGVNNWAFFTLDTLASTDRGVTSPTTVNFFAAKSMLKDVTPENTWCQLYINLKPVNYVS